MKEQMILTDFSGIYRDQSFYRDEEAAWVDVRELSGTNCYCDGAARAELEKRLQLFSPEGIHFLDSGNYHYMSLLWMEKVSKPFRLLVFDNHTDMQPPAFGGLLSCGGWIAAALEELPLLKEIVLIGPDQAAFDQVDPELRERVIFLSRERLSELFVEEKTGFLKQLLYKKTAGRLPQEAQFFVGTAQKEQLCEETDSRFPWYISVDKDVMCPGEALTGWSQGDMTLSELTGMLEVIFSGQQVIGMDVCGEADAGEGRSDRCNDEANRELLKLWKKYKKPESTGGRYFEE